jgi:hypothetical protein
VSRPALIAVGTCAVLLGLLADSKPAPIRFRELADAAGIHFVLNNCPTDKKQMIETMAGGLAVFDYNGDGRPDVFFTNGADLPSVEKNAPKYWNRLYRNDGGMKFTDVTEQAGVAGAGYSMGAAAADYDNDGHVDLFVAGVNRNILYHNLGNGRFEDVTAKAGIASGKWAVTAGWFDYDRDGKLDLLVVHYAKWTPAYDRYCGDAARSIRVYCHPKYFEPLAPTLYHNRGDGTFEDVTAKAGLAEYPGRAMGLAFADYDQDGYPDAFVTNDNMPNFLFHNLGNGTFEEVGLAAGVALRDDGKPIASMGTDFRDYDNDGLPDLIVTALAAETFPIFHNAGKGNFVDATYTTKMGPLSIRRSGWGNGFVDFNNDGWKDLFTSGAHVNDRVDMFEHFVYKEPNSVFVNLGNGTFGDVSAEAGFNLAKAHRGCAYADFDGDGRIDVVVSALNDPAELWQNTSPEPAHWIILKLTGTRSNRDAIGAHVRIGHQSNDVTSAVSYSSSALAGVHFGLGSTAMIDRIEIAWPSGTKQVLENVKADQVLAVREP